MRATYLVPILAVLAILVAGLGATYASARMPVAEETMTPGYDAMGGMGSMMNGTSMSRGMEMGSFDEDRQFDLQFIDEMIVHHQMAIISSEHMISDSERPELRQLAKNIQESQAEQIDQMQEWRDEWYPDAGRTSSMPGGMMGETRGPGMMGGSMHGMAGTDATDAAFLRMMIPHHQQAIDMSEEALDEADHPELRELAKKIIAEQSAEIELMQGYLEEIEGRTTSE
jgi:uncharacterized protein (DUF305 family)